MIIFCLTYFDIKNKLAKVGNLDFDPEFMEFVENHPEITSPFIYPTHINLFILKKKLDHEL